MDRNVVWSKPDYVTLYIYNLYLFFVWETLQVKVKIWKSIVWLKLPRLCGDAVFVEPVPKDVSELKRRITEAEGLITRDAVAEVCEEMACCIDAWRTTRWAHIKFF
jgi:hypothetical protein